jgi:hypothetical protein
VLWLESLEDRLTPSGFQFGSPYFSASDAAGTAQITVVRSGDDSTTQSVNFTTSDGTAVGGVLYTPRSGTLTFDPGVTSQTFDVPVIDNGFVNYTRTVHLTLSQPTANATLGSPATAVLTIVGSNQPLPANALFANNAVQVVGDAETSLQYAPDGSLVQLLQLPDSLGFFNYDYVTRNDFGESVAEPIPLKGEFVYQNGAQLLFDGSGIPNFLAIATDGQLLQIQRQASGWTTVNSIALPITLAGTAGSGVGAGPMPLAAAVGPNGSLNIVVANNEGALLYGTNSTGTWTFQQVTTLGSQLHIFREPLDPRFLSLAMDSQGFAHIAYTSAFVDNTPPGQGFGREFSALDYATNASGSWTTQVVAQPSGDTGDDGLGSSIAVGPGNQVAIAGFYLPEVETGSPISASLIYYTLQPNGAWSSQVLTSTPDGYAAGDGPKFTGYNPLLRFDAQGNPNIAFSDYATQHFGASGAQSYAGQIRHAVQVNGQWSLQTVFPQTNPLANELAFPTMGLSPNGTIAYSGIQETAQSDGSFTNNYVLIAPNPLANLPQQLANAASALTHSAEYLVDFISNAYQSNLGRTPDLGGLTAWLGQMQAGLSDQQLEGSLMGSTEFIDRNGGFDSQGLPGAAWVNAVYQQTLGRDADSAGTSLWLGQLAAGSTPAQVATRIASSAEAETLVLNAAYGRYLDRPLDSSGQSSFLQLFAQGTSNESLFADLVASHEYYFNHGLGNVTSWVQSAYHDVLQRTASTTEVTHWVGSLLNYTQNQRFVVQVFLDLLHRPVDPAGLAGWTNFLNAGGNRQVMVQRIEATPEYQQSVVKGLYEQYLHRPADAAGLNAFAGALAAGQTDEQVAIALAGSGEYFQVEGGGTNAGFITALFNDALHRALDPGSLTQLQTELTSGVPISAIAAAVIDSREYAGDLVQAYFQTYLHRNVDSVGLNSLTDLLTQGGTNETVIAIILGSAEYYASV